MRRRDSPNYPFHRLRNLLTDLLVQGAYCPDHLDRPRNDVVRRATRELCHRDDGVVERVGVARDDVLKVRHDLGADGDGVRRLVGHRRVAAPAFYHDLERIRRGQHRAVDGAYLPDLELRPEVDADDRVHPLHYAGLDHLPGSSGIELLGVLEQEADLTPDLLPHPREELRRPQQHRGVPVVPTGVHHTGVLRDELEVVLLLDGQRVHVRTESDRAPRLLAYQTRYHARRGWPGELEAAEGLERLVDEPGGLFLFKRQLGALVQVPPPADHLIPHVLDLATDSCRLDGPYPLLWPFPDDRPSLVIYASWGGGAISPGSGLVRQLEQRPVEDFYAGSAVLLRAVLGGVVAEAVFGADEDHADGTQLREVHPIVPGAARQLEGFEAELLARLARRDPDEGRAGRGREPLDGLRFELDAALLAEERRFVHYPCLHVVSHVLVDVAQVEGEGDAPGDDVDAAGREVELADGTHARSGTRGLPLDSTHHLRSRRQSVAPEVHGRGARVSRLADEGEPLPRRTGDAGNHTDGQVVALEDRTLFDVQLDVGVDGASRACGVAYPLGIQARGAHSLGYGDAVVVLVGQVLRSEGAGGRPAPDHAEGEACSLFVGERDDLHGALRLHTPLVHGL